jgi:catechol 2,3-dioxygenase-like lactoylglutathione lyase family enzyme
MLANLHMYATIPATDLDRAKRFYAEKLGMTPDRETEAGAFYRCRGDSEIFVFASGGAPSGTHTQAAWVSEDIEAEVAALKARGVTFEEYDTPYLRTVDSVAITGPVKAAWFKDSEGNVLGLVQYI